MRFFSLFLIFPFFIFSNLSLEEKIGQMLLPQFYGEQANDDARTLVKELKVGGILLFQYANGLSSPQQVRKLTYELQELSGNLPLFIAVDQEGGRVQRLKGEFTEFPSAYAVAKAGKAFEVSQAIAEELKMVGINWNLAPVVDVNSNPRNPIIGDRSFGSTPSEVIENGSSWLKGGKGILQTLKHFPGHGDVDVDSHHALPIVNAIEVASVPFRRLALMADCVMTGHLMVPEWDEKWCATLSKKILEGILRKGIGFDGIIVSDSLAMQGVRLQVDSLQEAALRAILAGCDVLCLGGKAGEFEISVEDVRAIRDYLVEAVASGALTEERIDASVERILEAKGKLDGKQVPLHLPHLAHQSLAEEIRVFQETGLKKKL